MITTRPISSLSPEDIFQDPFNPDFDCVIEKKILGGQATVFKVKGSLRDFTLKIPLQEKENANILREKELLVEISQNTDSKTYIIEYLDSFPNEGMTVLIFPTYSLNLKEKIESLEGFPIARSLPILYQLLVAVSHLKRLGIIHRDIKPSNILIGHASNDEIRLCDFGIAVRKDGHIESPAAGTPQYLAPERYAQENDFSADIWSIGCVAAEMCANQILFPKRSSIPRIHVQRLGENYPERYTKINKILERTPNVLDLKNFDEFMELIPEKKRGEYFERFKEHVRKMLIIDPIKRYRVEDFIALRR